MKQEPSVNHLYPVFLKMDQLRLLIVGGGEVALEKLHFLLKSSPNARVTLVAPEIRAEIVDLFTQHQYQISLIKKPFDPELVQHFDLVVAATNIRALNHEVHAAAKTYGKIINVADTPDLCDFYMGSIVTRGPLKVAISTNGLSPTFAKRFRQWLERELPDDVTELLDNLHKLRNKLPFGFSEKVKYLNKVTRTLISQDQD